MKDFNDSSVGIKTGKFFMSAEDRFMIPNEYLEVIGTITVNFVLLERMLIVTLCNLMSPANSDLTRRLVGSDFFVVLISKFKKLSIYKLDDRGLYSKEIKIKIKKMCSDLENISIERDKLVHSLWTVDKSGIISRLKYKKNINEHPSIVDEQTIDLQYLVDFNLKILEYFGKLNTLKDEIIKLLGISDDKRKNQKKQKPKRNLTSHSNLI